MANFFRQPEPPRSPNDSLLLRRLAAATAPRPAPPPPLDSIADSEEPADFDMTIPWNPDEALRREMERLEAARHFPVPDAPNSLGAMSAPYTALESQSPSGRAANATPLPSLLMSDMAASYLPGESVPQRAVSNSDSAELRRLRADNEELTKLLEETRQIFEQATQQEQETARQLDELREKTNGYESQIAELQSQVSEKNSHLELLSSQIQELEQHVADGTSPEAAPPVPRTPHEDELMRMADELEKEQVQLTRDRRELDDERSQLREDEESLMKQMREMEVGMAKERAELARQRTELQRLHAEIKRDLDMLTSGDRALTERMQQFQRRHQDVFGRQSVAPQPMPPAPPQTPPPPNGSLPPQDGGIRRFFGGPKK